MKKDLEKIIQKVQRQAKKGDRGRKITEKETEDKFITPMLAALGWKDEAIQPEYGDRKRVDYALKKDGQPLVLVEAKPMNDNFRGKKGRETIKKLKNYCKQNGPNWGILTNGIRWKVYYFTNKGHTAEEEIFDLNLDPDEYGRMAAANLAKQMRVLHRTKISKGSLDDLLEKSRSDKKLDNKLKLALHQAMHESPEAFYRIVKNYLDGRIQRDLKEIRKSLHRILTEIADTVEEEIQNFAS